MKKLRKLFQLLPVFAIAFVSGLSAILSNKRDISPSYADNLQLVSTTNVENYEISYEGQNGVQDNVEFHFYWDFLFSFYRDISNGTYTLIVSITQDPLTDYVTINGVDYYSYPNNSTISTTIQVVYPNLVYHGEEVESSLSFGITDIQCDSDGFLAITNNPYYYYWGFGFTCSLELEDFGEFDIFINSYYNSPNNSGYNSFCSFMIQPNSVLSGLNAYSINNVSFHRVTIYLIDLTSNNYDFGYSDGYSVGSKDGFNDGYLAGTTDGYNNGYNAGYEAGVRAGEGIAQTNYNDGYNAGYNDGFNADTTATTIFSGILQVGMLPINVLLAIFNFEILGINLSAFISAILTVCLTIIVIRTIKGGSD